MALPGLGSSHIPVQSPVIYHRRLFARIAAYDGAKILLHSLRHRLEQHLVAFLATNAI